MEAETLYEAAGMGLARLKKDGWIEGLGPGSRLEILVRSQPPTTHHPFSNSIAGWDGVTTSPAEVLEAGEGKADARSQLTGNRQQRNRNGPNASRRLKAVHRLANLARPPHHRPAGLMKCDEGVSALSC